MRQSIGLQNNNPLNIRFNKLNRWQGLTGEYKGFCTFESLEYGLRAGIITLRTYILKHKLHTLDEIISRFAPSSENPTRNYIFFVRNFILRAGCSADYIEYNRRNFLLMVCAMCMFESWAQIAEYQVYSVIVKFKLK